MVAGLRRSDDRVRSLPPLPCRRPTHRGRARGGRRPRGGRRARGRPGRGRRAVTGGRLGLGRLAGRAAGRRLGAGRPRVGAVEARALEDDAHRVEDLAQPALARRALGQRRRRRRTARPRAGDRTRCRRTGTWARAPPDRAGQLALDVFECQWSGHSPRVRPADVWGATPCAAPGPPSSGRTPSAGVTTARPDGGDSAGSASTSSPSYRGTTVTTVSGTRASARSYEPPPRPSRTTVAGRPPSPVRPPLRVRHGGHPETSTDWFSDTPPRRDQGSRPGIRRPVQIQVVEEHRQQQLGVRRQGRPQHLGQVGAAGSEPTGTYAVIRFGRSRRTRATSSAWTRPAAAALVAAGSDGGERAARRGCPASPSGSLPLHQKLPARNTPDATPLPRSPCVSIASNGGGTSGGTE